MALTGSRGHRKHKLSNPSMLLWFLLRGGCQSGEFVALASPLWLHGIKAEGCLGSSGVILLNPGTVCQEQRARCQDFVYEQSSLSGVRQWCDCPLKSLLASLDTFGWFQIIVPDPVLGTETGKWIRPCPYLWRVCRDNKKNSKAKVIITSLLFKVYTEGRVIGRLQRERVGPGHGG